MARNPDLEAKLIADPGNVDAHLVYADFLQSNGDPRGELIALSHAGKTAEVEAHLKKHAEALWGPLWNYRQTFDGTGADAFEWRLGFIRSARLSYESNSAEIPPDVEDDDFKISLETALADLLQHPSGMLLETLVIPLNMLDDGCYFGPLVKVLAQYGAPALRNLRIGEFRHAGPGSAPGSDYDYEISWSSLGDASALWKALPRLERLVLQVGLGSTSSTGTADLFGPVDLPKLRHLEIITGGMSQECVRAVAGANWPSLTYMDLWTGSSDYGFAGTGEDLQPILDGAKLPKLEHLGLMNSEVTDDICTRLGTAKILPRLKELNLAYGTMSDEGARALANAKKSLGHLRKLTLDENYLSNEGIAAVEGLCAEVTTEEQKTADDDDRYVSLAE